MISKFSFQCPVCYWVKGDDCQDWHFADKHELDQMAKPELCPFCTYEQETANWGGKKP